LETGCGAQGYPITPVLVRHGESEEPPQSSPAGAIPTCPRRADRGFVAGRLQVGRTVVGYTSILAAQRTLEIILSEIGQPTP
jgi:hypothetical protein